MLSISINFAGYTGPGDAVLGVYSDNGSGTAPSSLLAQIANFDPGASGVITAYLSSPLAVTGGTYYWIACHTNQGLWSDNSGTGITTYYETLTSSYGALPSSISGTFGPGPTGFELGFSGNTCN
jgi:hypothetical protein